jgi:hypothetical protein
MVIVDVSSVTRANSSVVALAMRPRITDPTGRLLEWRVLKRRNAFAGSTDVIVTVTVPLAELVVEPFWNDFIDVKHDAVAIAFAPTDGTSVNIAATREVVAAPARAAMTASERSSLRTGQPELPEHEEAQEGRG